MSTCRISVHRRDVAEAVVDRSARASFAADRPFDVEFLVECYLQLVVELPICKMQAGNHGCWRGATRGIDQVASNRGLCEAEGRQLVLEFVLEVIWVIAYAEV